MNQVMIIRRGRRVKAIEEELPPGILISMPEKFPISRFPFPKKVRHVQLIREEDAYSVPDVSHRVILPVECETENHGSALHTVHRRRLRPFNLRILAGILELGQQGHYALKDRLHLSSLTDISEGTFFADGGMVQVLTAKNKLVRYSPCIKWDPYVNRWQSLLMHAEQDRPWGSVTLCAP